ncbi:MAG: PDZ domain-containing protein [Planctomycetota bacterium]|nr:PDZ domain-containing protein [Planctomycetota bacterium]
MTLRFSIVMALAVLAIDASIVSGGTDTLSPSEAQGTSHSTARLSQYLEKMDADDWRTREEATIALARDQSVHDQYIEQRLSRGGLNQEQRMRLLRAMETRLLLLPRGAIGISMKQHITDFKNQEGRQVRGVEVVELLPGMPAEEQLRVGDVLLSIEDQPFDNPTQVSSLIKQYWPGEVVELEVARDEPADAAGSPPRSRRLRIQIKLGSTDQLAKKDRRNPMASNERNHAEARVRSAYQHYSPESRLMLRPEIVSETMPVSDIPMGLDPDLILQQVLDDRSAMNQGLDGSLTPMEFQAKWRSYTDSLSTILNSTFLNAESREVIERLRARVLEIADLEG